MPTLLVCPNCGGPLPAASPGDPVVRCIYCGSRSSLALGTLVERHDGDLVSPPTDARERAAFQAVRATSEERHRIWKSFVDALAATGEAPAIRYETFRAAGREHLGAFADSDAPARVVYKLALEFEAAHGVKVREPLLLLRLSDAYAGAVERLRKAPETTLNMPFFTATAKGPVHYQRSLDVATIAALADGDPEPPAEAAKASRGWLARLFG